MLKKVLYFTELGGIEKLRICEALQVKPKP